MSFLDDYEPVEDRLAKFWKDHPEGRILTELVSSEGGDYIFKAYAWRGPNADGLQSTEPDATGYAHDSTAALPNNMKASALEVCETSAIGRALANLGYAPKGKRPSREEMHKSQGGNPPFRQSSADAAAQAPASPTPEAGASREGGGGTSADGEAGDHATAPPRASGSQHLPCGGTWQLADEKAGYVKCSKCGVLKKDHGEAA